MTAEVPLCDSEEGQKHLSNKQGRPQRQVSETAKSPSGTLGKGKGARPLPGQVGGSRRPFL